MAAPERSGCWISARTSRSCIRDPGLARDPGDTALPGLDLRDRHGAVARARELLRRSSVMTRNRMGFTFVACSAAAMATWLIVGCSSSASPATADAGESDAGESADADVPGDATHRDEQAAPSVTYACALEGGFGSPCTLAVSGPDTAECTDPRFPDCFVGGQGGRCSAACGDGGIAACPVVAAGAGCVPTECNARGYCK